jgi:serine protease Do
VRALVAVYARYEGLEGYGQSVGSGFLITADGYIVTNYHVVEESTRVSATTYDGKNYAAQVIGYDASNDVALLKIDGKDLPFVLMGSSDKAKVGDQVAVIGNPLGDLTATLTVGYISARDRIINSDGSSINMLQTDAAINSGNSGGPMFNMYGEVIGIITAKYSGDSGTGATVEGLGFAIPIDDVAGIISDLKEFGYVTGAYLGVYVQDVAESAQFYGIPAGAYVTEAVAGYCAAKAGIRAGDIIINVGGYDVDSLNALTRALRRFKAGDTTSITVYRNGKREYLTVTFDEKPVPQQEQNVTPDEPVQAPGSFEDWLEDFLYPFFG